MTIYNLFFKLLSAWLIQLYIIPIAQPLHISGEWKTSDFFLFLGKFGFQQTDSNNIVNTQGYIYGNITSKRNISSQYTFVVIDSELFLDYFVNRLLPLSNACIKMFEEIDKIAWDSTCNLQAKQDYVRYVPCIEGQLCSEDNIPNWIIPGSQFTYRVQDTKNPRFWYISMTSCTRFHHLERYSTSNTTPATTNNMCNWTHNYVDDTLKYDIWVVNGDPGSKQSSLFEHQFSFEMFSVFEVYLVFFILYLLLLPLQIYAVCVQRHKMPALLLTCIVFEFLGICFNLIHVLTFANNGSGLEQLKVLGDFIDTLSQCFFMLLLLAIVMGWVFCHKNLPRMSCIILFTVWSSYTLATIILFCWNQAEIDFVSEIEEWSTTPGHIILVFRILIMICFLWQLRNTFLTCLQMPTRRFYLHFGAGYLVWFVYLPLAALICNWVSVFWRYKTMISIIYSADFISLSVMVHLLWTSHSYLFFNQHHLQKIGLDYDGLDDIQFSSRKSLIKADFNLLSKDG